MRDSRPIPNQVLLPQPPNELPAEVQQILENSTDIEIRVLSKGEGVPPENFTNYPSRKRVKVLNARDRSRLRTALYEGIAHDDPGAIPCFDPGYAIRAATPEKSIGLVICFGCDVIAYYIDDRRIGSVGTNTHAQQIIEELLQPQDL